MDINPTLVRVEQHVTDYLEANDHTGYNRFRDFDWSSLRDSVHQSGLTDLHVGAVETAMLVAEVRRALESVSKQPALAMC